MNWNPFKKETTLQSLGNIAGGVGKAALGAAVTTLAVVGENMRLQQERKENEKSKEFKRINDRIQLEVAASRFLARGAAREEAYQFYKMGFFDLPAGMSYDEFCSYCLYLIVYGR